MKKKTLLLFIALVALTTGTIKAEDKPNPVTDPRMINGDISLEQSTNTQKTEKEIILDMLENGKQAKLPALPTYRVLNVVHQTQNNDYYCGPASASMVVKFKGRSYSQASMAAALGTTASSGTPAGANVSNALNSKLSGISTYSWAWHVYTDIAGLFNKVQIAMSVYDPVMVNTYESPGDVHLLGHNTGRDLFHFGVINGVDANKKTVKYLDPGYGRFKGFVKDQWATQKAMSYAAGGRGLAW